MSTKRTIYYVFGGRFPSEKAHALYIAKVADAFLQLSYNVVLVVPRRKTIADNPQHFFNTKEPLHVVYIPTIDVYNSRFFSKNSAYFINYTFFTLFTFFFFLFKTKKNKIVFSNESLPSLLLSLSGKRVVYEMHDYPEHHHFFFSLLYKRVFKILSQNQWKKEKLQDEFHVPVEKIIVEPNGVELEKFDIHTSKEEARKELGLPQDTFLAVYTGHLFDWKGADTLALAVRSLPSSFLVVFVGGTPNDVAVFKKKYADITNIMTVGYRPHAEIPLWQKASDCLILPNTAQQNISKFYTSPMKLFEYMASGRPIIASDLPSIRAVVSGKEVMFVEADNPTLLASAIVDMKQNYSAYQEKSESTKNVVSEYTWDKRAERLIELCRI